MKQKQKEEEKVTYYSISCPKVTPSWQRVHLPYAVMVKENQARREDYLKPEVEMKPSKHSEEKKIYTSTENKALLSSR